MRLRQLWSMRGVAIALFCLFGAVSEFSEGLEGALGGGEEVGEGVAADGGTQRTRQSLEDALNLVVLVGAASRDVEIHSRRVA